VVTNDMAEAARSLRREVNLGLEEMDRPMGWRPDTWRSFEAGTVKPSIEQVRQLARVFGYAPRALLERFGYQEEAAKEPDPTPEDEARHIAASEVRQQRRSQRGDEA
jgi:ribosome-binding protein aMBF1 (putative translation factor)